MTLNAPRRPGRDPNIQPAASGGTEKPKDAPKAKSKKSVSRGNSEEPPDSSGPKECVEMVPFVPPGSVLENQGRAASMPRLNAELSHSRHSPGIFLTSVPDSSPMRRSASTAAPQRPLEVDPMNYTLEKPNQERTHHHHHHHHHHHRCHHRRERERERRQRSLDTPLGGAAGDAVASVAADVAAAASRERGRSHDRKQQQQQHSPSDRQRYYSCDRCTSREAGPRARQDDKQWLG